MFSKIKSLLGKPEQAPRPQRENPNFITARERIVSLLNDMVYQRIVVRLDIPGENHKDDIDDMPTTFFKQVGSARAALERLEGEEAHAQLVAAEQFKVISDLYGSPFTFQTKVNQIQSAEGKEFYIIDLPSKVFYPESEEYRKFRIGAYKRVPVYLKQPNQEKPIPGVLDTLSIGGISVYLSSENTTLPYLRKGEKLNCSIMVEGDNVKFEIVVENVKRLSDDKSIRVDCAFGNVSKEVMAVVKAMMSEAEQYLRNRARSS